MSRILDFSDGFTSATEPTTGDVAISGSLTVSGDLTVNGTTTTLNTATLDVEDLNITVNKGGNDTTADGAGLTVDRTGTDGSMVYDSTKTSKWKLGNVGSEVEVVTVSGAQTLTNKTLTSPAITTPTGIVKGDVGLGNVDNTSDATKNSASATLTNKTLTSPVINTPTGIVKGDIGLGNVDNTSDATKNSASATLTNKTLTSPVLTTPSFDILTATEQSSTPSSPSSGSRKIYVKDDGKAYLLNSSGTETALGSGGAGGINYLSSNPDAETSTTGWATYADAAASSPVDGTGGSPSSTYTRSTSSPLRGSASFLWTKSAANRQGEGFSYAFTIDSTDQAKVLQVAFDYKIASGTYADSDMTIWIYDVTNAALIQPAGYTIQNASVSMKQLATFQSASNSTSYRLIVHTASTSASAYTLQFDNFSVGPQIVTNGAAITDWTSWTPTGSWSTNSTYSGYYRRVGDTLEFQGKIECSGAPTSATLTINLPSGMVVDTAKYINTTNDAQWTTLGQFTILDNGVTVYSGFTRYSNTPTTAQIAFSTFNASSTYVTGAGAVTQAVPHTFGSGDAIQFYGRIPIVGWSSNVQLSSDTDTRVVAMRSYLSANQTGINPNNSTVKINFNTASFDTHAGLGSNRYTIPVSGKYSVKSTVAVLSTNVLNSLYQLVIYKNGSIYSYGPTAYPPAASTFYLPITDEVDCVAGDYIEIYLYGSGNNSASTLSATSGTSWSTFSVKRLSGPSVIAASETVHARYGGSTTTLTNNSTVDVTFTTKEKDTHNAYSGATFTVPVSGTYQVVMGLETAAFTAGSVGTACQAIIKKNGSDHSKTTVAAMTTSSVPYAPIVTALVSCLAGDTLKGCLYHNLGATPTLNNQTYSCYISFTKVGNY